MVDIVQQLCIIYAKEAEPKNMKKPASKLVLSQTRFIKLKPTSELNKLQCLKLKTGKSSISAGGANLVAG